MLSVSYPCQWQSTVLCCRARFIQDIEHASTVHIYLHILKNKKMKTAVSAAVTVACAVALVLVMITIAPDWLIHLSIRSARAPPKL